MNTILMRKYSVKLLKYWLVGYIIGVLLAVALVSLKNQYFWYDPDNTAHHAVFNPQSKSTKLRVVFDGSMKSKNKKPLNDFMLNGPVLQDEFYYARYMRDNWIPDSDELNYFLQWPPNNRDIEYKFNYARYMCDNWIPGSDELTYVPQWPPNIRGIEYLMHIEKGENRSVADALAKRIRVFCIVMTSPKYQKSRSQVIKNTWGQRCDGIIFMSTVADPSLPAVALKPNKDDPRGKFKETFQYVYHHHANDADWFFKAEDDTYIIMENLKYMLDNYSCEEASYFGYMSDGDTDEELSSKAGYVLSKAALKAVVDWGPHLCNSSLRKDYQLIECLRKLKIKIVDTHDSEGHARFFPYSPPKLLQSSTGASDFPISFHKITDNYLYVMEFFVYHLQAYGIVANYSAPEPIKESGISDIKRRV